MEIVKEVATEMIANLQGVNLGLMRYSDNDEGNDEESGTGRHGHVPGVELTTTRARK